MIFFQGFQGKRSKITNSRLVFHESIGLQSFQKNYRANNKYNIPLKGGFVVNGDGLIVVVTVLVGSDIKK